MSSRTSHPGIAVGADGSPAATMAIRWAAREAAMRNVPLRIVHVDTAPSLVWPATPVPAELYQQREERAKHILAEAIKIARGGVPGSGHLQINDELFLGATAPTLVEVSKGTQMMVVGCRGQGALRRNLLGSVSTALVHHAHCPVAVIHDEAAGVEVPSQSPVLVGIDGSPASELATAIAFDEASWRGVELVTLHAWSDEDMSTVPGIDSSAVQSAAEKMLAQRVAGFCERYPDVAVRRRVVFDRPARHLLEESESCQLLVVGSHGRGGFAGMLLGSVSTAVAHATHVPLIVARQR